MWLLGCRGACWWVDQNVCLDVVESWRVWVMVWCLGVVGALHLSSYPSCALLRMGYYYFFLSLFLDRPQRNTQPLKLSYTLTANTYTHAM